MLEVVAHHLHKAGIPYHLIQGDIPPKKRMDIVDDFNINSQGPPVRCKYLCDYVCVTDISCKAYLYFIHIVFL